MQFDRLTFLLNFEAAVQYGKWLNTCFVSLGEVLYLSGEARYLKVFLRHNPHKMMTGYKFLWHNL